MEALGVSVLLCFSSLLLSVCGLFVWLPPFDSLAALDPAPEAALEDILCRENQMEG